MPAKFRNPPRLWRLALVATVYGVVGMMLGMLAGVLLGKIGLWLALGGIAGAALGARLEGK